MCKLLMSNCLRNSHTKKHGNRLIFDKVIGKIKMGPFCVDTLYIIHVLLNFTAVVCLIGF